MSAADILRPLSVWLPRAEGGIRAEALNELGLDPVLARLLASRGFEQPGEVEAFLDPSLARLSDPLLLPDAIAGRDRLVRAVRGQETVLIHGDYDVDGLTGAALLCRCLGKLGARPTVHIPDRLAEGYGVSPEVVSLARQAGASLVITCDCGVRALEAASALREAGIDLVVTDHHEPGEELPDAVAVVNPKRHDSRFPFRELAGVGVAFRLLETVVRELGLPVERYQSHYLDLAALGTIADVVPLLGDNRVLATQGLRRLRSTEKVGLRSLMRASRLEGKPLDAGDVGFRLAPRLNAAGRVEHANRALRVLLTSDRAEADVLARELEELNSARQRLERAMEEDAMRLLIRHAESFADDPVLVLTGEGWHRGVAGLVASRIRERSGRPTLVLCPDDSGIAVGSGRSVDGYDLAAALDEVGELLLQHGGHAAAAGLQVAKERVGEFRRAINARARVLSREHAFRLVRHYDLELEPHRIDRELAADLADLEPFGAGNPEPVFLTRGMSLGYVRTYGGEGEHLGLSLMAAGREARAVYWRRGERAREFAPGMKVDVLYTLGTREWQGVVELQLVVKDLKPAAG